jgi:hypothetical protein
MKKQKRQESPMNADESESLALNVEQAVISGIARWFENVSAPSATLRFIPMHFSTAEAPRAQRKQEDEPPRQEGTEKNRIPLLELLGAFVSWWL